MKLSQMFFETRKEMPKDAEMISHKLLLKGGYISLSSAGVYTYLPLFLRAFKKAEAIIIEEMNRIGAQQLLMPALTPREIWEESGRWKDFGNEMFRLQDRKKRDYALCPTHEEIITDIARKNIQSYKQMPQIWYQIQTKFRDEPRPRSGLLRVRYFEMKDSYSFDVNTEALDISYNKHRNAYERIFSRCGLDYTIVSASSGLMGGSKSEEFMAISDSGEDNTVICTSCGYSANSEVAETALDYRSFPGGELIEIHTPVKGDIESVSKYLRTEKNHFIKSILLIHSGNPIFILIPGDREIDEKKLELILKDKYRYADDEEIVKFTKTEKGYISPLNLNIKSIADISLKGAKGMISGANKREYHIKNIDIKRDIKDITFENIILINENDKCVKCGHNSLNIRKCIEIGHIFQLGTKYSKALNATFVDREGNENTIVMGSYGIGLGRMISTVIEQHAGENDIKWPITLAPYTITILPMNISDNIIMNEAERIYDLLAMQYDTLIDDRDIRAGNKFKDADLIGAPVRIIIGRTFKEKNEVEIIVGNNGDKMVIPADNVFEKVKQIINNEYKKYEYK